jgi:hypothetical protein
MAVGRGGIGYQLTHVLAATTVAAAAAFVATELHAQCLTLTSGPIAYDVTGCKVLDPETFFDTSKPKYEWIAGLDAAGKKQFYDKYRGVFVRGKVVKSTATQKGLSTEQGVLTGETVFMLLPPPVTLQCNAIFGKRLAGNLKEVCCDGGGEPPCLLDTSFLLTNAQVIGAADSGAGDSAEQALRNKKYKEAVALYQKARANDELDVRGHYNLGLAYRQLDQCGDALGPLKVVYDKSAKKQVWADEEAIARKATFLLARCYAKRNDPGAAVMILNGYLLEPGKYKSEIRSSLKHKDFGWIHTSKEYRDYEKEARAKLK